MAKKGRQSGMTLISLLVASGILVILATYVAMILFDVANFDLRSQSDQYITSNSRFIISRLKYDIHRAESVNQPEAGTSGSQLSLNYSDGSTVSYSLNDTTLKRTDSLGSTAVSSNMVEVSSFVVSLVDDQTTLADLPAVNIDMNVVWLGQLREGQKQDLDIDTTISLRKQ